MSLSFVDRSFPGVDAYEATLEYGADGVKKSRKLGRLTPQNACLVTVVVLRSIS